MGGLKTSLRNVTSGVYLTLVFTIRVPISKCPTSLKGSTLDATEVWQWKQLLVDQVFFAGLGNS